MMLAAALGRPSRDFMVYPYMSGFLRAWANLPADKNGVHQLIMKTGDQLQPAYLQWQANINNNANLPEAAAADLAELASRIESALEPIKMVLPTMDELIARVAAFQDRLTAAQTGEYGKSIMLPLRSEEKEMVDDAKQRQLKCMKGLPLNEVPRRRADFASMTHEELEFASIDVAVTYTHGGFDILYFSLEMAQQALELGCALEAAAAAKSQEMAMEAEVAANGGPIPIDQLLAGRTGTEAPTRQVGPQQQAAGAALAAVTRGMQL